MLPRAISTKSLPVKVNDAIHGGTGGYQVSWNSAKLLPASMQRMMQDIH